MTERYTVRVTKDYLVFSAGHFITFNGQCERLHGHNWRVAAEVDAPLDENQYVFDFIAIKDELLKIISELDHRMLVAMNHPLLPVTLSANEVEIRFGQKRWVFPREDCALLPIANTTAELLAHHIGQKLHGLLNSRYHFEPQEIRVEVEENFGQFARCILS